MRALVAGASVASICGVRGYAEFLSEALQQAGLDVSTTWWQRNPGLSFRDVRRSGLCWLGQAEREIRERHPDIVLWHYSAFTLAYKGVPVVVGPFARTLGAPTSRLVTILHELAYHWRSRGVRGAVWATTQRAVLPAVIRHSSGLVLTMNQRADWLARRPWIRHPPPLLVTPTFSPVGVVRRWNQPSPTKGLRVGMFGFGSEDIQVDVVIRALSPPWRAGLVSSFVLVGAPGEESQAGRRWRQGAQREGCAQLLSFTGPLPRPELTRALADVDLFLTADFLGPTSRRTSLAAVMALGKPVVALDGPATWDRLAAESAVVLVDPEASALSRCLTELATDRARLEEQGRRAAAFYDRHQDVRVVAASVADFLTGCVEASPRRAEAERP